MKPFLSLLIALLLVLPVLPAGAAAQTRALTVSFCDSANDWVNGAYPAVSLSADSQLYTEAPCSLRVTGDLSKGTSMVLYTYFPAPVDATPYTHLEFDLYTRDADLLNTGSGQLELTSSGACDVAELAFSMRTVLAQVTADGWNHICLPLASGGRNSTDPARVYDPAAVNFMRLYLVGLSRARSAYFLCLDHFYFSDGVSAPAAFSPWSDYRGAAPLANNGYLYGDVSQDGAVNASDALCALQQSVDKVRLTNRQLAMADVDNSGRINAVDALMMLQYAVEKRDSFPKSQAETLPAAVETGLNEPHLVHTQYAADQVVVAETDVIAWGARGDGVTDDTIAFQKALACAAGRQGGTVFVPAGHYVIRGNLTIPNGVTLQGDAPAADAYAPVEGTVLLAYAGRGDETGTPFISMDSSSALANLSIWYPEQTADAITPYPWTIRQAAQYGINVTNVRLVNSYLGLCMGPNVNALQNIRGLVGTALKMGLILDYNVDICRVENVSFTPDCWLSSGLGDSGRHEQALRQYLYENATAFQFESVDWTYIADVTAHGYHAALVNAKPTMRQDSGSPNGHVYNVDFRDCYIGYDARYVNPIGMMITKGTIRADYPVLTSTAFDTSFSLNRLTLQPTGRQPAVTLNGSGVVSLADCTVESGSGVGIAQNGGTLLATCVTFTGAGRHLAVSPKAVSAALTNCMTPGTLSVEDPARRAKTLWDDRLVTADYDDGAYDYNQPTVTRPAGDAFADLTAAPYNVAASDQTDISHALQQALADVAARGGGVVYLPSGRYRLEQPVTVPTGVELRGSCTFPQHSHAYSTTLYTAYGKHADETAPALITLAPAAGMAGFKVYYDTQPGGAEDCDAYAFTARGTGMNDYICNVNFVNSFFQTDLNTYRCDGHVVNGATGYPLEQGIVVGGGSANGIVRDCQFNVHYFGDNPYYRSNTVLGDYRQYATDHSEAFVVNNVTHQLMYHNFVLGVHSGIAVDNGADVFVLAHGTDGGDRSMTVRGTPSGKVTFVNTQLVVIGPGATMAYINIEPSFTGTVDMIQTNLWGQPTACSILVGGGTLNLTQGTNVRSGTIGARVWNGAGLNMNTVNHMRSDLQYDLYLDEAGQVLTFGNRYAGGGRLFDWAGSYGGVDLTP